jgi:hypothetical protein
MKRRVIRRKSTDVSVEHVTYTFTTRRYIPEDRTFPHNTIPTSVLVLINEREKRS